MSEAGPSVSVVVPTRNRARRLGGLLAALERQTLAPERFEVIVVDDGSTDETRTTLATASEASGLAITTVAGAGAGPAAARNAGWRRAQAPVIAFTDDDCEPAPAWLERGLEAVEAHPGTFVQGPTDPMPRERPRLGVFSRTKQIHALGPWYQTCNMLYPRELLERLDGFDERFTGPFGEDADLAWRAIELGARPVFASAARVHHAVEELGPAGYLRSAMRDPEEARIFRRHPGLLAHVSRLGAFKSESHAYLALALAGLALGGRWRPALLLTLPYGRLLAARLRAEGAGASAVPFLVAYDAIEALSATRGSVRHRVLAL